MGRHAKITRKSIADSAIRLVVQEGAPHATIRAISSSMAVNEAALYRHFKSKDELLGSAYMSVVEEMVREKRHLAKAEMPFRELMREWIRLTYSYFDKHPDAFTYVLLLPPPPAIAASGITRTQGALFMSLLRRAAKRKEIRQMPVTLAYSHFSGIMLNVPRLLREGALRGRAVKYVDEVAESVWRVLGAS